MTALLQYYYVKQRYLGSKLIVFLLFILQYYITEAFSVQFSPFHRYKLAIHLGIFVSVQI